MNNYNKIPHIIKESNTLTECLRINQYELALNAFSDLDQNILNKINQATQTGIVKRMKLIGEILYNHYGLDQTLTLCQNHISDIVRGWACYAIAAENKLTTPERLSYFVPFADDYHFGVREWAWLALRPHLINNLQDSFLKLLPFTQSPSEYLRRFSSEILRPRGVWCAHIQELKDDPAIGLIILEPLKNDPSLYVRKSVANWLNDAGKTQPEWVKNICKNWVSHNSTTATEYICKKALRNLKV